MTYVRNPKIFDILCRFRCNKIGLIADIKQAFLNVEIADEHRDFLRFLWYDNVNDDDARVIIYRFLRVVFGVNSSPFLLGATVRHHLDKYTTTQPEFVDKFIEDLYVDDSTSGIDDVAEGVDFYHKAKAILSAGGFDLRKWITNDSNLQSYINDQENIITDKNSDINDNVTYLESQLIENDSLFAKVLGIDWDTETDEFVFRFTNFIEKARTLEPTKRNILKVAASFL